MSSASASQVKLDGALTSARTKRLKARLLRALAAQRPVVIDAGRVDSVDTAALQLLFAFVRDAADEGVDVCWRRVSPALHEAARDLGLASSLGLVRPSGEG